ncbi:KAP family P-loop NTPase fold protein [Arthrobacter silvisoli]|uniref:KAP family P-loop NTPase fold protein n=1 Tax=Arthrobacter silvisoli TaxID=2291022 RepID=UPI001444794E|nr:P-loop NTPase fold protein [Arthrobacter silvisoli]
MIDNSTARPSWSDESLQQTDIAGRGDFARVVASRIDSCVNGQSSTVFGLVGPWGGGKTTLLKEVISRLSNWKSVWFSPWSVSDAESITAEFVSALSEAFPKSKSVKDKLSQYSRFGTPLLKLIPVIGDAASSVAKEAISDLAKRPSWHSEFGELSGEIAEQGVRVLVIVDDVDRLDGEELRALLRVVRLLGRFTNVHYLLAYDQATIESALRSTGADGESSEFMEKIVQYPFEVPPVPMVVRRRWSRAILDSISPSGEPADGLHQEHREELIKILASGLETPRAANRLREQMHSLSELISAAEVDAFDFTALTWLRITHHRLWDDIRLNPETYLSWNENDSEDGQQRRIERVDSLVSRGHAQPARDAVQYLFRPMSVMDVLAGRQGRMQKARYFDRYFQVGLADDDVSERKTQVALAELAKGMAESPDIAYLKAIILGDDPERSALALDIASSQRRLSPTTSLEILGCVEDIRSEIRSIGKSHPFRLSAAERWLSREIFLSLETNLVPEQALIARFGYEFLTASAYSMMRTVGQDRDQVKRLYAGVARRWISEVCNEPLASTLCRPELLPMTSFCVWIVELEDHKGFLSRDIFDAERLIDVAARYVSFNEWVGTGVEYEVVFREEEFRFAVAGTDIKGLSAGLPHAPDEPDYQVSDRSNRDLTEAQRRDFAIRQLHALLG